MGKLLSFGCNAAKQILADVRCSAQSCCTVNVGWSAQFPSFVYTAGHSHLAR